MAGFLIGWTIGPLLLLECVRTKRIHYYVPAFPAAALLVGWQMDRINAAGSTIRHWAGGRFALGMLGVFGTGVSAGMIALGFRLPIAIPIVPFGACSASRRPGS